MTDLQKLARETEQHIEYIVSQGIDLHRKVYEEILSALEQVQNEAETHSDAHNESIGLKQ